MLTQRRRSVTDVKLQDQTSEHRSTAPAAVHAQAAPPTGGESDSNVYA